MVEKASWHEEGRATALPGLEFAVVSRVECVISPREDLHSLVWTSLTELLPTLGRINPGRSSLKW